MNLQSDLKHQECVFDWSDWAASFPELESFFRPETIYKIAERAAIYFNPGKYSVVCCLKEKRILMNLLVSHLVCLQKKTENGDQLIGSISSVTEGSVSLHVDTKSHAKNKIDPWLAQTRNGYEFWALTKKYRSTFYTKPIPDPRLRIFP